MFIKPGFVDSVEFHLFHHHRNPQTGVPILITYFRRKESIEVLRVAGEMAQRSKSLVDLPEDMGSNPTWHGSNYVVHLLLALPTPGIYVVHRHTWRQNIHTQ